MMKNQNVIYARTIIRLLVLTLIVIVGRPALAQAPVARKDGGPGARKNTALPPNPEIQQAIVLEGATIIDVSNFGNSQNDIKDSIVVVRGGQIIAAGPRRAV